MTAIVQVRDLVKRYAPDEVLAVDGITFDIETGEIFSLLGPNGAGKTTTISMLSCLLKPTAGDALIGGHSIVKDSLAVRRIIGVVPQEIALYETLSARQNLMFWGRMYDMAGKELKDRVEQVLDQIGLLDKADAKIETYSGGPVALYGRADGGHRSPEPPQHPRHGSRPQPARHDGPVHHALYGRGSGTFGSRGHR